MVNQAKNMTAATSSEDWKEVAAAQNPIETIGEQDETFYRHICGDMSKLTPWENKHLAGLEAFWKESGLSGNPLTGMKSQFSKFEKPLTLRALQGAKWDYSKTTQQLKEYKAWRDSEEGNATYDQVKEILSTGICYWHGRDKACRPLLMINLEKAPQVDVNGIDILRMPVFLLDYAINNCLLPGKVEQWCVLVECSQCSVWDGPTYIRFFSTIIPVLQTRYKGRLSRMYVIGLPYMLHSCAEFGRKCCDERTAAKVRFVDNVEGVFALLEEDIRKEQLEERFGGHCADVSIFKEDPQYAIFPDGPITEQQ